VSFRKTCCRAALCVIACWIAPAYAQTADEIIATVNSRDEGITQIRNANLTLKDKSGKTREQVIRVYRKYYDNEKRTVIFYLEPANVKDTGFLTFDYPEAGKEDDQWLYLPAMRKVRRISASNKGDYFLGTDLTYDDLKRDSKVSDHEYTWTLKGTETVAGVTCHVLEGTPKSETIADELGYGKGVIYVDPATWLILRYDYWDVNGNQLKRIENKNVEQIDGIWTTNRIEVTNHKTGHATVLDFTTTTYSEPIDDELFSDRALLRGAPR
jgi:hypothetical protein